MPIYETDCSLCGVKENYYTEVSDEDYLSCPDCGALAPRIFSIPAMQPDRFWHNNNVLGSTVNNMSEYRELRNRLEPATKGKLENIGKRRKQLKKETEEKNGDKLEKFLANELAPV